MLKLCIVFLLILVAITLYTQVAPVIFWYVFLECIVGLVLTDWALKGSYVYW